MIGFYRRWFKDTRSRLIEDIRALTDAEAREIVKEAKPGLHLHVNPKGRRVKKDAPSDASLI